MLTKGILLTLFSHDYNVYNEQPSSREESCLTQKTAKENVPKYDLLLTSGTHVLKRCLNPPPPTPVEKLDYKQVQTLCIFDKLVNDETGFAQ